jgi:hypothetical protein
LPGEAVDLRPASAGGVAEQDMGHRPDHGGHPSPEGEDSVAQPEHAGQAGQHYPSAGGAAAHDQGPAATPQQQRLDLVQAGRADPAPKGELRRGLGPQPTLAGRPPGGRRTTHVNPRPVARRGSGQEATAAQAVNLQPDQLLGPLLRGIGDDPPPLAVAAGGERLSGSRE